MVVLDCKWVPPMMQKHHQVLHHSQTPVASYLTLLASLQSASS